MKASNGSRTNIFFAAGGCLIGIAILLLALANFLDGFAEWYAVTIYEGLVNIFGRFFGWFPFSVSELGLYILLTAVVVTLIRGVVSLFRKESSERSDRERWRRTRSRWFFLGAMLLFLYVSCCGINYHRVSFAESADLEIRSYSSRELAQVCRMLTEDVNEKADEKAALAALQKDEAENWEDYLQEDATSAMKSLAEDFPQLEGYYPKPKAVVFSEILSVQKITGIYSPFTIEANYNRDVTEYNLPFSACHELAHLRGYMQEEEANFIAYLACIKSENIEFQYSGSLRGWINCMNALYWADYDIWAEIRRTLSEKVEADLAENRQFWSRYEGKVADISEKVNDHYLRANGQEDGVKSYNRMVDLIVAYYAKQADQQADQ